MVAVEGEEIVPDDVAAAVVLVESGVLAAEGDVVLQENSGAAFVGVEAPAAVGVAGDVVEKVVPDDGAGLRSKRVDAAHVAESSLADVVDVVELDDVFPAGRGLVTPVPTHGDPGVVEVVDVVMRDAIGAGLEKDDADARVHDAAELVEMVVGDRVAVAGGEVGRSAVAHLADADAARAEGAELVADHFPALRASAEFQSVAAEVAEAAVLEDAIDGELGPQTSARLAGGLRINAAFRRHVVVDVDEVQPAQGDVGNSEILRRVALPADQRMEPGRDDDGLVRIELGRGHVADEAGFGGVEPFAGLVERVGDVLDPVACVGFIHPIGPHRAGHAEEVRRGVDAKDGDLERGPFHQQVQLSLPRPFGTHFAGAIRDFDGRGGAERAARAEEAFVGRAGADGAFAVDEELPDDRALGEGWRELRFPDGGVVLRPGPTRQPHAAGEQRRGSGSGLDGEAGIRRTKDDRLDDFMPARGELNGDIASARELPGFGQSPGRRGEGAVLAEQRRRGLATGPRVIAIRRDVKNDRLRRDGIAQSQREEEKENKSAHAVRLTNRLIRFFRRLRRGTTSSLPGPSWRTWSRGRVP